MVEENILSQEQAPSEEIPEGQVAPEVQEEERPLTMKDLKAFLEAERQTYEGKLRQVQSVKDRQLAQVRAESQQQAQSQWQARQRDNALLEEALERLSKAGEGTFDDKEVSAVKTLLDQRRQAEAQEQSFQAAQAQQQSQWDYHLGQGREIRAMVEAAGLNPNDARFKLSKLAYDQGDYYRAYEKAIEIIEKAKQTPPSPAVEEQTPEEQARKGAFRGVDTSHGSKTAISDEENYRRYGRGEPHDKKRVVKYMLDRGFISPDDI